jgi:hypothetical protein
MAGVRYDPASDFVLLEYGTSGVTPSLNITDGWALLVSEQSSIINPLPPSTTVEPPVVAYTTYANGTTKSQTMVAASTMTSGWNTIMIAGQPVLGMAPSSGEVRIQWWHEGVWYQLYSMTSLQDLEQVASSMISSSST